MEPGSAARSHPSQSGSQQWYITIDNAILGRNNAVEFYRTSAVEYLFAEAGKFLRVITLPDGETVHNAFFDRDFPGR